jgi:hypothetical protein
MSTKAEVGQSQRLRLRALVDLDIHRARFQLIAVMDVHLCGALLPSDAPNS